jgi:SAM-dependent methyltransferase
VSDTTKADIAYRQVSQGIGLLWQGDFYQARQLLEAIKRRLTQKSQAFAELEWPDRFHRIRQQRTQVARQAGLLLIRVMPGYTLDYPRAPQMLPACELAYGNRLRQESFVVPLTELMGVMSAYEWHISGLPLAALGDRIYPRWGVFAPTRHEYLDLVMQASLPEPCRTAVDVGTGTGVLAMLLAKRGVDQVIATDNQPSALACAQDNINRLGFASRINVQATDLIAPGRFDLLVCNPPWLPGAASSPLEAAVYDPQQQMLKRFLKCAAQHLNPNGQAWLILSDLAEHLRLRSRDDLLGYIAKSGLTVIERLDIKPTHGKLNNAKDPLAPIRKLEITSLWRLSASV